LGQTQILLGRLDLVNTTYLQGWRPTARYGQQLAGRGKRISLVLDRTLTLAAVRQAGRSMPEALALLQQARWTGRTERRSLLSGRCGPLPVYLWLASNDVEAASRRVRASGLYQYGEAQKVISLPSTFLLIELLILTRLYLAQGDLLRADSLLSRLEVLLAAGHNRRRRIQWRVMRALVLQAEQRLAEPMRRMRTFVDLGAVTTALLKALLVLKLLANYSHTHLRQLQACPDEEIIREPLRLLRASFPNVLHLWDAVGPACLLL
jgi:hypothetical protein